MGVIRESLFGKVDLDTLLSSFLLGVGSWRGGLLSHVKGSANSRQLSDNSVACFEVGGAGGTSKNNFDHHYSAGEAVVEKRSASRQVFSRISKLVDYVDELDCGKKRHVNSEGGFPSLSQLVSGMLLTVKDPQEQMKQGHEILLAVLQSGIDPYGCMDPILDELPNARSWTASKRKHDSKFAEVSAQAKWFMTEQGHKLAVVETTWVGAPGALYGHGADIVIALNPKFERAGTVTRKFTLAGNDIVVLSALVELNSIEFGWGGPAHGTIGGSPMGKSSRLSLIAVTEIVVKNL